MSKPKFKRGDLVYHMDDPWQKCVVTSTRGEDCFIESCDWDDDGSYLVPESELQPWNDDLTFQESVV